MWKKYCYSQKSDELVSNTLPERTNFTTKSRCLENMKTSVIEFHAFQNNVKKYIVKALVLFRDHFQNVNDFKPPYKFSVLNENFRYRYSGLNYVKNLLDEMNMPCLTAMTRCALCTRFLHYFSLKGLKKVKFMRHFQTYVMEIASRGKHILLLRP